MTRLLLLLLALSALLTGCSAIPALQGQAFSIRPAAPDFDLKTTQGGRCALADHQGEVVAVYMTNL